MKFARALLVSFISTSILLSNSLNSNDAGGGGVWALTIPQGGKPYYANLGPGVSKPGSNQEDKHVESDPRPRPYYWNKGIGPSKGYVSWPNYGDPFKRPKQPSHAKRDGVHLESVEGGDGTQVTHSIGKRELRFPEDPLGRGGYGGDDVPRGGIPPPPRGGRGHPHAKRDTLISNSILGSGDAIEHPYTVKKRQTSGEDPNLDDPGRGVQPDPGNTGRGDTPNNNPFPPPGGNDKHKPAHVKRDGVHVDAIGPGDGIGSDLHHRKRDFGTYTLPDVGFFNPNPGRHAGFVPGSTHSKRAVEDSKFPVVQTEGPPRTVPGDGSGLGPGPKYRKRNEVVYPPIYGGNGNNADDGVGSITVPPRVHKRDGFENPPSNDNDGTGGTDWSSYRVPTRYRKRDFEQNPTGGGTVDSSHSPPARKRDLSQVAQKDHSLEKRVKYDGGFDFDAATSLHTPLARRSDDASDEGYHLSRGMRDLQPDRRPPYDDHSREHGPGLIKRKHGPGGGNSDNMPDTNPPPGCPPTGPPPDHLAPLARRSNLGHQHGNGGEDVRGRIQRRSSDDVLEREPQRDVLFKREIWGEYRPPSAAAGIRQMNHTSSVSDGGKPGVGQRSHRSRRVADDNNDCDDRHDQPCTPQVKRRSTSSTSDPAFAAKIQVPPGDFWKRGDIGAKLGKTAPPSQAAPIGNKRGAFNKRSDLIDEFKPLNSAQGFAQLVGLPETVNDANQPATPTKRSLEEVQSGSDEHLRFDSDSMPEDGEQPLKPGRRYGHSRVAFTGAKRDVGQYDGYPRPHGVPLPAGERIERRSMDGLVKKRSPLQTSDDEGHVPGRHETDDQDVKSDADGRHAGAYYNFFGNQLSKTWLPRSLGGDMDDKRVHRPIYNFEGKIVYPDRKTSGQKGTPNGDAGGFIDPQKRYHKWDKLTSVEQKYVLASATLSDADALYRAYLLSKGETVDQDDNIDEERRQIGPYYDPNGKELHPSELSVRLGKPAPAPGKDGKDDKGADPKPDPGAGGKDGKGRGSSDDCSRV